MEVSNRQLHDHVIAGRQTELGREYKCAYCQLVVDVADIDDLRTTFVPHLVLSHAEVFTDGGDMSQRENRRQHMQALGFNGDEIRTAEELAARNGLSVTQVLRGALGLYAARDSGFVVCTTSDDESV